MKKIIASGSAVSALFPSRSRSAGSLDGAEALASLRECLSRPIVETMDVWLSSRQRLILLEKKVHHIETSLEVIAEHASVGMEWLLSDKDPAAKMEDFLDQILAVKEGHLKALRECLFEAGIDWEWADVAKYCHLHSMLANGSDDLDPAKELEIRTHLADVDVAISAHHDVTISGKLTMLCYVNRHYRNNQCFTYHQ